MEINGFWLLSLISAYFLVLLGGVVKSRYSKTGKILPSAEEFFLANNSLSTPVLVATFIGTIFSAFTVVGVPSAVYANGLGNYIWLAAGGSLLVVSLFVCLRAVFLCAVFFT